MDAVVGLFSEWWKHRSQKQHERVLLRRAALEQLLKLVQRVQNEVVRANLVAGSFRDGLIDEDEFLKRLPDILHVLAEGDLSNEQRVQLSSDLYGRGDGIYRGVEALRNFLLSSHPREAKTKDDYMSRFSTCISLAVGVEEAARDWVKLVESEFKKTF